MNQLTKKIVLIAFGLFIAALSANWVVQRGGPIIDGTHECQWDFTMLPLQAGMTDSDVPRDASGGGRIGCTIIYEYEDGSVKGILNYYEKKLASYGFNSGEIKSHSSNVSSQRYTKCDGNTLKESIVINVDTEEKVVPIWHWTKPYEDSPCE